MPSFFVDANDNEGPTVPRSMVHSSNQCAPFDSCRLSCLSNDGGFLYSLVRNNQNKTVLHARALPLERDTLHIIELPEYIVDCFNMDAPLELLCVDGAKTASDGSSCLCVYTSKQVWIWTVQQNSNTTTLLNVTEPFQHELEYATDALLVRVRPPPRDNMVAPATCLAALVHTPTTSSYSILLYHGDNNIYKTSIPLEVGVEPLQQELQQRFVDFCFGHSSPSTPLSWMVSTTLLLLQDNGSVYCAGPIVFDQSVVTQETLQQAHDYFTGQLQQWDRPTPQWRHAKVGAQYLLDVYYRANTENAQRGRDPFCTAHVLDVAQQSAAQWPLKLQPLRRSSESSHCALAMEPCTGPEHAVGIALAYNNGQVQFLTISPTALLPRFEFEPSDDTPIIDAMQSHKSAIVETVQLTDSSAEYKYLSLMQDPVQESLLHYVTSQTVYTISTNALRRFGRNKNNNNNVPPQTDAWMCLHTSDSVTRVTGVVVPLDVGGSHELWASLSTGELAAVSIPETQFVQQFLSRLEKSNTHSAAATIQTSTSDGVPLVQEVKPLVETIHNGLANMTRYVGSSTKASDIGVDQLALVADVKQRCDTQVALPLLQLKEIVQASESGLAARQARQAEQLAAMDRTVEQLRERMATVGANLETATANALELQRRSLDVLEAAGHLLPSGSKADVEFFKDVKRMEKKTEFLERVGSRLLAERVSVPNMDLDDSEIANAHVCLKHVGDRLKVVGHKLDESNTCLKEVGPNNRQ